MFNNLFFTNLNKMITFFHRTIATFLILMLVFLTAGAVTASNTSLQQIDASLGLVKTKMTRGMELYAAKVRQSLFEPVKASAFSLNPLDGLAGAIVGPILSGISGALAPFIEMILKSISSVINAIVQPIFNFLNSIFDKIDSFLNTLQKLADTYSGTLVAIGYLAYKDIEGTNRVGSSSFLGSREFTYKLFGHRDQKDPNGTSANVNLLPYVTDAVAWLDFMNVQRFLQYSLLGDFFQDNKKLGGKFTEVYFEDMKLQIQKSVLGDKCTYSGRFLSNAPVINNFVGFNPCQYENTDTIVAQLNAREYSIKAAVNSKLAQYQLEGPADCKAKGFFEVADDFDVKYDPNSPGSLGQSIAIAAQGIKKVNVTPEECEAAKQLRRETTINLTNKVSASSLFTNPGEFIGNITKMFDNFFDKVFATFKTRFDKLSTIVNSIKSGNGIGLYGSLIKFATTIKTQVKENLAKANEALKQSRVNGLVSGKDVTDYVATDDGTSSKDLDIALTQIDGVLNA